MALREILRVETDKNSMIKLNNYKKEDIDKSADVKREDLKRSGDDALKEFTSYFIKMRNFSFLNFTVLAGIIGIKPIYPLFQNLGFLFYLLFTLISLKGFHFLIYSFLTYLN